MSASLECCLKSFVRDVLKKDDKFINFEKDKRTIKEYVSNNKRATIHLYEKKKMNNGMVAEIIKMSSCRNITVQFEDGEIVYHKCYQSFVKGNISHALGIIFSVIDRRIRSGRPLIITTNLPLKEIKSETMLDKRRIYDRILEMCTPMYVGGTSKREAIASMKMEKAKTLLNTNRGEEKCE